MTNAAGLPHLEPCPRLRCREMLYEVERDTPASDPCWCVMTQTCIGPDGQLVDRATCVAGRSCFNQSASGH